MRRATDLRRCRAVRVSERPLSARLSPLEWTTLTELGEAEPVRCSAEAYLHSEACAFCAVWSG
jgi:hypothetical protein